MNKKKWITCLVSLVLAITLLASCAPKSLTSSTESQSTTSSGTNTDKYPEYLNLDSQAPVIKTEYAGKVKPKLLLIQDATGGKWDDVWLSKFLKAKYNLEFDEESVLDTAWSERKSVLLTSNDLPDIMLNIGLKTTEIYNYGQEEHLLLACDEYISEKLTPNLYRYFQNEDVAAAATTPDGHVYILPQIGASDIEGYCTALFINKKTLDTLGLENPKTLDDFNKVLYAFKEKDPNGVGKENCYPFGGGMEECSNTFWVLNALGYITRDPYGLAPALREGKVVIPAYDTEVYKEFLKQMNQYYKDGIINPNFFTIENTEIVAQLNNGQNILYRIPVYTTGITTWSDWDSVYPLTSQWNDKMQCPKDGYISVGNFAIAAKTEYPELCLRFADLYYAEDSRDLWCGPGADSEYNFGYVNTRLNETGTGTSFVDADLPAGVDLWTYLMKDLCGFAPYFGALNDTPAVKYEVESRGGKYPTEKTYDLTNPDAQYRSCVYKNLSPYGTATFPTIYYLDEATNTKLSDLTTVIEPYIKQQVALFITGQRSLDEVEAFKEELKSQGIEDLLKIYQDIYSSQK